MIKNYIISLIGLYKKIISPVINRGYCGCRFYPSCSDYAQKVIAKKGILKGSFFVAKRIFKCNPFSQGGIDEI